jgi:hypothetical protein
MSTYDRTTPTDLHPPTIRAVDSTSATAGGPAWALCGVVAGLCGLVTFIVSPTLVSEWTDEIMADNELLAAELVGSEAKVWVTQVLTSLAAILLVVFGAGLRRRLAAQEPVGSLLPTVALGGTLLTATMCLVGGGISTELFWSLSEGAGATDPDTLAAQLGIFNTMLWVWAGMGLTSGAVAVAALRHGSVQRWIGWVSVVFTVLVLGTQLAPVQYMALVPASLWLVIAGAGLARRERIG